MIPLLCLYILVLLPSSGKIAAHSLINADTTSPGPDTTLSKRFLIAFFKLWSFYTNVFNTFEKRFSLISAGDLMFALSFLFIWSLIKNSLCLLHMYKLWRPSFTISMELWAVMGSSDYRRNIHFERKSASWDYNVTHTGESLCKSPWQDSNIMYTRKILWNCSAQYVVTLWVESEDKLFLEVSFLPRCN